MIRAKRVRGSRGDPENVDYWIEDSSGRIQLARVRGETAAKLMVAHYGKEEVILQVSPREGELVSELTYIVDALGVDGDIRIRDGSLRLSIDIGGFAVEGITVASVLEKLSNVLMPLLTKLGMIRADEAHLGDRDVILEDDPSLDRYTRLHTGSAAVLLGKADDIRHIEGAMVVELPSSCVAMRNSASVWDVLSWPDRAIRKPRKAGVTLF